MKRRNLIAAGAGAALAPLLSGRAQAALAGKSAIVIGSGPGGDVAAYRLGQAGIQTTVLGRGQRSEAVASQPRRTEWEMVFPSQIPYTDMDSVYFPRARSGGNYLKRAIATGNVAVHPQQEVTEIREVSGAFEVVGTRAFTADFLFMAMGTLQSTSLLVTAKAKGGLPRLGPDVGKGFGTNGAVLMVRLNQRRDPGPVRFFDDRNPYAPAAVTASPVPAPDWMGRASAHLILTVTSERGEIRYDSASGAGKVYWPYAPMQTKGDKAARDLATRLWWETSGSKGRLLEGVPSYDFGAGKVWHPLGGMVMGKATDFDGRSVDYPNLYCVDGSALPGSTALGDPALTITANAERIMDRFLSR